MENQKILDAETNLTENDQKTFSSDTDDRDGSDGLKHKYENAIDDDLIVVPEKTVNAEKTASLENTFEVIDQESKAVHNVQEEDEDNNIFDEEKDNLFEIDHPSSHTKIEDLTTFPKLESPKAEEPEFSENLEPMIADNTKASIIQEIEPVNTVQSNLKISETPEIVQKVSTKKDTDEGDVCDIKIGPDELFCRIGLDKWFNPEKLPPKGMFYFINIT
ncbi:PREDICTED: uncharacterized protein LOC107165840 [Diuraphis noxia]|uniref:uncharacterized protein LOC107165840 n=1 Tax=Diuraphis noxia TaxID=143948 RepID=UPI000763963C|nr:PREDICTED: uncharacterized protein LOC107165840 [Diuraphis noxia]